MTTNPLPKKYPGLTIQQLTQIEEEETYFLWEPYVPAGALTLIGGYGGMGKSMITCAIAADVTAGRKLPGAKVALPPQTVLIVSAEDDPGHVIKPRMRRLGADMDKVYVSEDSFILNETGIGNLTTTMRQVAATILFLDPIVSYLGAGVDINRSNETRSMMGPLARAAAETNCAVVVVAHRPKNAKGRDANNFMGSADFVNTARSALMVDENPDGSRFMAHVKHNWSGKGPTLGYKIVDDTFEWLGQVSDYSREGPESHGLISNVPLRVTIARNFLHDTLKNGPMGAAMLMEQAKSMSITPRTLIRAKEGIAKSVRKASGEWEWHLIGQEFGQAQQAPMMAPTMPRTVTTLPTSEEIFASLGRGSSHLAKEAETLAIDPVFEAAIAKLGRGA